MRCCRSGEIPASCTRPLPFTGPTGAWEEGAALPAVAVVRDSSWCNERHQSMDELMDRGEEGPRRGGDLALAVMDLMRHECTAINMSKN